MPTGIESSPHPETPPLLRRERVRARVARVLQSKQPTGVELPENWRVCYVWGESQKRLLGHYLKFKSTIGCLISLDEGRLKFERFDVPEISEALRELRHNEMEKLMYLVDPEEVRFETD